LPREVDVTRTPSASGDLVRTVLDEAATWRADVIVIGPPAPGPRTWILPGPVHERVLRRARCTVVVTVPPVDEARRRVRLITLPRLTVTGRRA
jgi:nucleotide-binding universal stress UspA family protein